MDINTVLLAVIAVIVFLDYIENSPFLARKLRRLKQTFRHWRARRERP